jgi:hypothetical protein
MALKRHNHSQVVSGTAAEHAARSGPLKHWEMGLATDTGEVRMGPGMWSDLAPVGAPVDSRVRAATTVNITRATALNAGDTLDGVVLVAGDLVLVKNQSAPQENGVYVVGAVPARAAAYDTYDEHALKVIYVEEGTANADKVFRCTSATGGTLNTTGITYVEYAKGKLSLAGLSQLASLTAAGGTEPGTSLVLVERANGTLAKISLTNLKASINALP